MDKYMPKNMYQLKAKAVILKSGKNGTSGNNNYNIFITICHSKEQGFLEKWSGHGSKPRTSLPV